jgi:hypothetical protein
MNQQIAYRMIQELSGVKRVDSYILNMCYDSVCFKYGLSGDREEVINQVRNALEVIFK